MTRAVFYQRNGSISGFRLTGHTDSSGSEEAHLVCAAISSAVYMAVNTVTDVIGDRAEITEGDGSLTFSLIGEDSSQAVLQGLLLHLNGLKEQYPDFIHIKMEVQHDA